MWLPIVVGVAALGVGATALLALAGRRREYRHGLIVGDSMNAAPVLTDALRQLTGIPWDNVAVSGRNSAQILEQLHQNFRPGDHDLVLVSIGANDGARDLSWTQRNVDALSRTVRGAGADLVIFTEPPLRGYAGFSNREGAVARSEAHRRWVMDGGARATHVVDLHRVIGSGSGGIKPEFNAGDGLHPNRAGRIAMARAVAARIV